MKVVLIGSVLRRTIGAQAGGFNTLFVAGRGYGGAKQCRSVLIAPYRSAFRNIKNISALPNPSLTRRNHLGARQLSHLVDVT